MMAAVVDHALEPIGACGSRSSSRRIRCASARSGLIRVRTTQGRAAFRAGIEFFDADPDAVTRFCETNRRER